MIKNRRITDTGGFSGVEITVAILILMIFVYLISVMFFNIYLLYTDSKRHSEAAAYATQIIEQVKKMYYSEVTNQNLAQKILEMNIPNGYAVQVQVENYNAEDDTKEDLVKNVTISINYTIGKQNKSVSFDTVKAKEVLITPNKPKLETEMVPVKYVVTDRENNDGYWQITTEDDPTWYSYENRKWANVMMQENLKVEGGLQVTNDNIKNLVGRKVETYGEMLVWIPRYAYNTQDNIEFLYNKTNKYIDENGDMQDLGEDYIIHSTFEEVTGFWFQVYDDTRENVETILESDTSAVRQLVYSKYGDIINIIENKLW